MELVTTDKIINTIKEWVETRTPISPAAWVDAAMKLNVLLGDDMDALAEKELELAQLTQKWGIEGPELSVAALKVRASAHPLTLEIARLKSKIKRSEELIRIAKLRARMADNEVKSY